MSDTGKLFDLTKSHRAFGKSHIEHFVVRFVPLFLFFWFVLVKKEKIKIIVHFLNCWATFQNSSVISIEIPGRNSCMAQ